MDPLGGAARQRFSLLRVLADLQHSLRCLQPAVEPLFCDGNRHPNRQLLVFYHAVDSGLALPKVSVTFAEVLRVFFAHCP